MTNSNIVRQKKGGGRRFLYNKEQLIKQSKEFWNFWEIRDLNTDKVWEDAESYEASIKPKASTKPKESSTKPKT